MLKPVVLTFMHPGSAWSFEQLSQRLHLSETRLVLQDFPECLVIIIIDKVAAVPTVRNRNIDTSVPMEIGIVAKEKGQRGPANCGSRVASRQQGNR